MHSCGRCYKAYGSSISISRTAFPQRLECPAIAYVGAWVMGMVEILTAVRHDIPVTAVVFHNRQWGAEKKNQVDSISTALLLGN